MTLSDISTVFAGAFETDLEVVFGVVFEVVFGVVFEVVFIDIDLLSSPIYRDVDYKKLLADRIIFKDSSGTNPIISVTCPHNNIETD